jgi:hypothetical protein
LRKTVIAALVTAAVGAVIGTLTDRTSLCQPDSLIQGHALWHVLAAAALWRLAPAIGARRRPPSPTAASPTPPAHSALRKP